MSLYPINHLPVSIVLVHVGMGNVMLFFIERNFTSVSRMDLFIADQKGQIKTSTFLLTNPNINIPTHRGNFLLWMSSIDYDSFHYY